MQIIQDNKKLIYSVVTLGLLWTQVLIFRFILSDKGNEHLSYVPKNAHVVLKINTKEILASGFKSIIFEKKDNEIVQLLRDLVEKKTQQEGIQKPTGIDFSKDFVYFSVSISTSSVSGYLFSLSNPWAFERNIKSYLNNNQVYALKNDIGIILIEHSPKNDLKLSRAELNILANNYLTEPSGFDPVEHFQSTDKASNVLQLWSRQGVRPDANLILNSDLFCAVKKNELKIGGELELSNLATTGINEQFSLVPNGFHVQSKIVSKVLNSNIQSFIENIGSTPDIKSFSLNYFGSKIINIGHYGILPHCDLLIEFSENFSTAVLLEKLSTDKWVGDIDNNSFRYAGHLFYYHQLNERTIYLGSNPYYPSAIEKTKNLVLINGDPKALTDIGGEGFRMKLLTIVPLFSASKNLTTAAERINIKITPSNNRRALVDGKITFAKEHYALNEFVRFGLQTQFFK